MDSTSLYTNIPQEEGIETINMQILLILLPE